MKYLLLLPAFLLDLLQFAFMITFAVLQFMTPIGGGVAGAAVAATYCYNASTGIISGIWNGIACAAGGGLVGAGLSAFAIPIGAAVDVALSITIGGGIIALLAFEGMFYPQIIIKGFLGEVTPFMNFLPFWSWMVWKCMREKKKEDGMRAGTVDQARSFKTAEGDGPWGLKQNASIRAKSRFAPVEKFDTKVHEKVREAFRTPLPRFSDIRPPVGRAGMAAKGAMLALLLIVGMPTHAQTVPDPIQYIVTPETPGADETVLIEVQGVGSFLGSADIVWKRDGTTVKSGVGERNYTFVTGALGQKTAITVAIDSSQGSFAQTFIFNPSRINLLWEAYTTVPPLYKGKALYSAGSDYKVVAFPTVYSGASRVTANALNYQWFYRDDLIPEASGLGRFTFSRTGDQLQQSEDVAVDVYYGTAKVGHGELSVPASDPFIQLYSRDALRGTLYDAALPAAISLVGREITVQAEPYYFSTATKKSGMIPFVWTLNDEPASGPDSPSGILTLRQSGSGTGSATIGVSLQNNNPDQFVQTAGTALHIEFGAKQGNSILNFFGL